VIRRAQDSSRTGRVPALTLFWYDQAVQPFSCGLAIVAALEVASCGPNATAPPSALIVSLMFDGPSSCAPLPRKACSVNVIATASPPSGDALIYSWSGCAVGTSGRAECTIDRPGEVTATVDVRDGQGRSARASIVAIGTNQPPSLTLGGIAFESAGSFEVYGNVIDPEEGNLACSGTMSGNSQSCAYTVAAATGDCGTVWVRCTCLAGLEVVAFKTAARGTPETPELTFELKDSWGLTAHASRTVSYPR
jgi:hypothetical protein